MKKKKIKSWSKVLLEDLETVAFELKKSIETPALILLEGPLGAGKTTFTKCFCSDTTSPTYSLIHESDDVLHGDFYRIEDASEIIHLDLPLYLDDKNYFFLEWGMKYFDTIEQELDENFRSYLIEIEINEANDSRSFELYEIS